MSPLLALIEDQVGSLVRAPGDENAGLRGVPATYLSSASAAGHQGQVFADLCCDPISPPYLPHISPISPLHPPCIS